MQFSKTLTLFFGLALALSSCSLGGNSTALSTLTAAINSIPVGQALLPVSLRDGTTAWTKSALRAVGDVSTLDPTALPGVRSEGYVRLQKELAESVLSNILLAFQQGMAGLTEMTYDSTVSLGDVTVTEDQAAILGVPKKFGAGKLVVTKITSDGDQLAIKWHFSGDGHCRLPDSSAAAAADTYDYYLHLVLTSANTPPSLVAKVAFLGTRTLTTSADDGNGNTYPSGTVFTVSLRGLYDASTGTQTVVFDPVTNSNSVANQTSGQYQKVTMGSSGTSYVQVTADSFNAAWGDGAQGGVLAKGSWTDGNTDLTQYRSEVYDGTGELLREKIASSARGSEFGFLDKLDDGVSANQKFLNLKDYSISPADTFQLRASESWSTSGSTAGARTVTQLLYRASSADPWTTLFSSGNSHLVPWIVVYRTASPWAQGDRVYFSSESDGSNYNAGSGYTDYTYSLDFTNSAAASSGYTGDSGTYFQHSVFPLKTLRLSAALTSLNYVIRQQEKGTETVTGPSGSSSTVSTFQYWLEKPQTGTSLRTTDVGFAPWLGDLEVSNALHNKTFWAWDASTKTRSSTASYVVSTTAAIPPGFALPDTATATLLATVDASLGDLAATALARQATGLAQAQLDAEASALGVTALSASDVTTYP
ncbi:MAG: hypothetical protein WCG80_09100 [Spirochaetales bacterium]